MCQYPWLNLSPGAHLPLPIMSPSHLLVRRRFFESFRYGMFYLLKEIGTLSSSIGEFVDFIQGAGSPANQVCTSTAAPRTMTNYPRRVTPPPLPDQLSDSHELFQTAVEIPDQLQADRSPIEPNLLGDGGVCNSRPCRLVEEDRHRAKQHLADFQRPHGADCSEGSPWQGTSRCLCFPLRWRRPEPAPRLEAQRGTPVSRQQAPSRAAHLEGPGVFALPDRLMVT